MPAPTAILFPGQGSHSDGMETPWLGQPRLALGLSLLDYDPFTRLAEGTRFQQPALFLCAVAAWDARTADLDSVAPIAAAGHSLGEYAALVAAGALPFEEALRVVDVRASAMAAADAETPGAMMALLGADIELAQTLAQETGLYVANDNAPGQVVLSGGLSGIEQLETLARDNGVRGRRLPVTAAFHTPLMAPAAAALAAALADVSVTECAFPVISNGTVTPFVDLRAELVANLLAPVRFRESLLLMQEMGAEEFDEVGPGRVLAGLARRTVAVTT